MIADISSSSSPKPGTLKIPIISQILSHTHSINFILLSEDLPSSSSSSSLPTQTHRNKRGREMAVHQQPGGGRLCTPGLMKGVSTFLALCLIGYILGPPLYWHLTEGLVADVSAATCPPCICDCSTQPLISMPQGLSNTSFADCMKRDPEVTEDMEKNFTDLLSEELKLREADASEHQRKADMALLEAKKMASQYQKEADKCNSGMETCEEARERAEATLVAQKRLTAMWELRARQRGWKEGTLKSQLSTGNVQAV